MSINGVYTQVESFRNNLIKKVEECENDERIKWIYNHVRDPFNMKRSIKFLSEFLEDNKYNMSVDGCIINRNYEEKFHYIFKAMIEHNVKYFYSSIRSDSGFKSQEDFLIREGLIKLIDKDTCCFKYYPPLSRINSHNHYKKFELLKNSNCLYKKNRAY